MTYRPVFSLTFNRAVLSLSAALVCSFLVLDAQAADLTAAFDQKHKQCLERIAQDPDLAFEEAMIWRSDGGGRRARHCEAMALFGLDHIEEAAFRLDTLAQSPMGGNAALRVGYFVEAADFWLLAGNAEKAYESASAGLKLRRDDVDLRIARARAFAVLDRYADAEIDLTNALLFQPAHADAYRYRADARWKLGNLDGAKADVEASLRADTTRVETALLRGKINEAIRERDSEAARNSPN